MKCKHCASLCVKNGMRNGIQRFRCKGCRKEQQIVYRYIACNSDINHKLIRLVREGVGIRSMSRILRISISTVISRIRKIGHGLRNIGKTSINGVYEIDELWTYIDKKENEVWITYSFDRSTSQVIDFVVGPRTKEQ